MLVWTWPVPLTCCYIVCYQRCTALAFWQGVCVPGTKINQLGVCDTRCWLSLACLRACTVSAVGLSHLLL